MNKLTFWVCSKCNGIVDQPCCRIDTAKLKPGVIPKGCIMLRGYRAEWRQENRAPIAQQALPVEKPKLPSLESVKMEAEYDIYVPVWREGFDYCYEIVKRLCNFG